MMTDRCDVANSNSSDSNGDLKDVTIPCLPPLPATTRRRGLTNIQNVTNSSTHNHNLDMDMMTTTSSSNNVDIPKQLVTNGNTSSSSTDMTIPSLPSSISLFKAKTIPTSNLSSSVDESHHNKENSRPNVTSSPSTLLPTSQHINQVTIEPSLSSSVMNKRILSSPLHTTSTAISSKTPNTIQRRQKRVLRSGDTIESFFCLTNPPSSSFQESNNHDSNNEEEYTMIKSLCHAIVNDIDNTAYDVRKWKQVLLYAYRNVERWWCSKDNNIMDSKDNEDINLMGKKKIMIH